MLRVVVYLNLKPIIDTHAVRMTPHSPKQGELCTYQTSGGLNLKQKYDKRNGAANLAIKLLKSFALIKEQTEPCKERYCKVHQAYTK